MEIEKTHIEGCFAIRYKPFSDHRGSFQEHFNWKSFKDLQAIGLRVPTLFVQDNIAYSEKNVLRGLHIQRNKPQGKLVRAISGRILDCVVDLRPESPTFKNWLLFELTEHNKKALYVPEGCAHGYFSLTESIVLYKCTTLYDKETDGGINPFDPVLKIAWPRGECIMSEKDKALPFMQEFING